MQEKDDKTRDLSLCLCVKKIFNKAGRLVNVTAGGQTTTYTYYDNGNKQSTLYPDGSSETYTYYDDNLLNTLVNKKANQTVIDTYSYTYDAAHNQTSKTDGKGTTTYTYDDLNRLGSVTEPNGRTTTYTYDAGGNRATQTVVYQGNTDITTYTCNNQNRLAGTATTRNGVTTETNAYTYDNNGNQLTVSQTPYLNGVPQTAKITNSTYDRLNQLLTTSMPDGTTLNNTYNGEGIRVKKEINGQAAKYLYEGDQILLEPDNAGNQTARNIWGTSLISRNVSGITAYYMYNGHGDVTALINSAGTILATYYYDAFGNIPESTGTINNPFKYAGYQHDQETGYYYLMSRYYDPVTARFISEDTYRGNPNDPLSLNLYTYCHNEPLMYTDPTGHIERPTPKKEVKPEDLSKKDTSRNQHNRKEEIERKKKEAERKAKEEREKNEKSQKYLVKSGDNLTKIGKKFDVSVADILKVNKDIKDPAKIQVGQIINIPAKTENTTNTSPNLDQKNTGDIKSQETGKIGSTRGPEDNWAMSGYSEETGNAPAEDPGLLKTIGGYIAKPFVALNDFMRESREDQEARQEKSDLQTYEWAQSLAKKNLSGQESDPNYSQKLQNETNRIFNTEKLLEGGIEVGIYIGAGGVKSNAEGTVKAPNVNTKVINAPEVKAPNAIKSSEVTNRWNSYLGENTTNINPRTGQVDPNRIFSADGTKSVRFDSHEMNSMGTPKFHYHEETWTYDAVNDTMTVTNTLQRIK
ncbi:RHS repeat-associated core domain-containing protein [Candidatus Formimonas warabiya]|uniref:LysM domain-containing protein n=1 Tax=Formimonas warabiya TaxID=1761012 RepID=A0A3G1KS58_FORW1|nr:RHS repeat-associated core domain-containing protein [Candidatus Formimonas warabiya]ATW25288.1 hypothetical protein DCMF_11370 [Candidatus Formimonas warabiya]